MPLQNRVTPFGDIIATPARGLFLGNRGIIHDPATRTLLNKRWALKAWLICRLHYKDVRREPMAQRSWTELFFLDEATALAAGHRPCFYCRRAEANAFRAAWARGHELPPPAAAEMDTVLHRQRQQRGVKRLHPLLGRALDLPDGAMIAAKGAAFLIAAGHAHLWSPHGYRPATTLPPIDGMLTPPATCVALAAGYRPVLHPSSGIAA